MANTAQPLPLLSLPGEMRQLLWDYVFSSIDYYGGVYHDDCPHGRRWGDCPATDAAVRKISYGQVNDSGIVVQPCQCNDQQRLPLLLCRSTYGEMQYARDTAPIHAEFDDGYNVELGPRFWFRVQRLTLKESTYPLLLSNAHRLESLPNLREIILPEDLGSGRVLRFPSAIPRHIEYCLRNHEGPEAMPGADMVDLVRSDLSFLGGPFEQVEDAVQRGVKISSTYRYAVTVSECFSWPFGPVEREVYANDDLQGTITWTHEGMVLSDIPDLRDEHWFAELLMDDALSFQHGSDAVADKTRIDWTDALGGWDLMNLLDRGECEHRRIWIEVRETSWSV